MNFELADGNQGKAMVFRPEGEGPFPALLVLHDILGFNDDLARIARRFATEGYVAMAPDFFGEGLKPICVVKAMKTLKAQRGQQVDTLAKARTWLKGQPDVDERRVGAVGFCMGGGFAVLHAEQQALAFVGVFYGDVPKNKADISNFPPCFAGYGERDQMFISQGRRLKKHLDELGTANEFRSYEGVGHSYMNQLTGLFAHGGSLPPMRAKYDESAAEDSWDAMLSFFASALGSIEDE